MTKEEELTQYCSELLCPDYSNCDLCMYNRGRADGEKEAINKFIKLVNDDGFKMRCLMTKLPFFEFVADELEQLLKEQKNG